MHTNNGSNKTQQIVDTFLLKHYSQTQKEHANSNTTAGPFQQFS